MVPPLGNTTKDGDYDGPKNENADKDEEFESLSRILQESIASARSSSQNSSRQTHINIPVRAFPPMSRGVPGKSLYIFHIRRTFHTHSSCSYSIKFLDSAIRGIIRFYSREAGVRNLERQIANVCRKVVRGLLTKPSSKTITISEKSLEKYLGVKKYRFGVSDDENRVGQVTGLAWTEVGGDLLTIESAVMPGKGKEIYTGSLGDVMQESIKAAMTVVRSRASSLGISPEFYSKSDVHFHVPEGATPKDGPSAGVGMCTAMVSALTKIPVKSSVAMTGEITLRGEVLPIGGLKEKLLAALRGGIKQVLIPAENERDLKDIPTKITRAIEILPVRWIDEVFELALQETPEPIVEKDSSNNVDDVSKPKRDGESIQRH